MNEETQLILKAKNSHCINELAKLSSNPYSNVRATVAKNTVTPVTIINTLAKDCVARVSYLATKNNKCQVKREFRSEDLKHKCIRCIKDESIFYIECVKCT